MVERFWGRSGVRAADYADLVRASEGGIRTDELSARLQERGFHVQVHRGRPRLQALDRGEPLLLLLGSSEAMRHYVVLAAAGPRRVWVHDPNAGPGRTMPRDDFLSSWEQADFWAVSVRPEAERFEARQSSRTGPGPAAEEDLSPSQADRVEDAIQALHDNHPQRARALALLLPDTGRAGALAWRIRATARFREGDVDGALAAWNHLGEPRLDHVEYRGFPRTRHRVVERHVGLPPGALLRPDAVRTAERRLQALPSVDRARLEVSLQESGVADVQGYVSTSSVWPGPSRFAITGVQALAHDRAGIAAGPFTSLGERWVFRAQWTEARRAMGGALEVPSHILPGIVKLSLAREEEWYADVGPTSSGKRVRGQLRVRRWLNSRLRVGAAMGMERREIGGRMATAMVGMGAVLTRSSASGPPPWVLSAFARGWAGEARPAARLSLELSGSVRQGADLELEVRAGAHTVSRNASPLDWPGAGTGRIRPALLRGEPLIRDGAVSGPAFGRRLLHLTVSQAWIRRLGPLQAGVAVFVDGAWVGGRAARHAAQGLLTPGAGFFADLAGRRAMVSVAWGDRGAVWSVRFTPDQLIPGA